MMNLSCSTPGPFPKALAASVKSAAFDDAALLRAETFGLPEGRLLLILVRHYLPWQEIPPEEGIGRVSSYYPVSHATGLRVSVLTDVLRLREYHPLPPPPDIPLKTAARLAGLGMPGRHTLLMHPRFGSLCHLRALLIDSPPGPLPEIPAAVSSPDGETLHPRCRHCRRCIDACPTGAIREDGTLDRSLCLRHIMAGHLPAASEQARTLLSAMDLRLLGCDTCQLACPVNRPYVSSAETVPESFRRLFRLDNILDADKEVYAAFLSEAGELLGKNLVRPRRMKLMAAVAAANQVRGKSGAWEHYPALITRFLEDYPLSDLSPAWKDFLAAHASVTPGITK